MKTYKLQSCHGEDEDDDDEGGEDEGAGASFQVSCHSNMNTCLKLYSFALGWCEIIN